MLEEGKVNEADKLKDKIEEKQREQRKILAKKGEEHIPRFFKLVYPLFVIFVHVFHTYIDVMRGAYVRGYSELHGMWFVSSGNP